MGSIRRKTHEALPRYTANSEHTIGAMDESSGKVQDAIAHIRSGVVMDIAAFKVSHSVDSDATTLQAARVRSSSIHRAMEEMSQKVQHANTHILRHQDHEHAHSSRSVQGSVQGGDG